MEYSAKNASMNFMAEAIRLAKKAASIGEAPIGAIVVKNGEIIASAHNLVETLNDPTAHAEVLAIQMACKILDSKNLSECELFVTLESCPMCAGAIVAAKLGKLTFGARDFKTGAVSSLYNITQDARLNWQTEITPDMRAEECGELLKDFFAKLR